MFQSISLGAKRPAYLALAGLLALGLSGVGLAPTQAATPRAVRPLVSGNILDSAGQPVIEVSINFDNVECLPNADGDYEDNTTPDEYGSSMTDADGDFAFAVTSGSCFAITAQDRYGNDLMITYAGDKEYRHIIGAPGGVPGAGLSGLNFVIDPIIGSSFKQLKVEVPNGQPNSTVVLFQKYDGEWYGMPERAALGIDLNDIDDPTVYDSVGGLKNPDTTALFWTEPGQTYALYYEGDQVNYPQLEGGAVLEGSFWEPDAALMDAISFTAPTSADAWQHRLMLKPGATVTGKVNLGLAKASETVVDYFAFWQEGQEWYQEGEVEVKADGTFLIGGLTPGRAYTLAVNSLPYMTTYLGDQSGQAVWDNQTFKTFKAANSGRTSSVGTITLTALAASISGTISGIRPNDPDGGAWTQIGVTNVETGEVLGTNLDWGTTNFRLGSLETGVYAIQVLHYPDEESEWPTAGAEGLVEASKGSVAKVSLKAVDRSGLDAELTETALRGKAAVGETITVDFSDWAKGEKLTKDRSFATTWVRNHKIVGTGNERVLGADDLNADLFAATLVTKKGNWPLWTRAGIGNKVGLGAPAQPLFTPPLNMAKPRVGRAIKVTAGTWAPSVTALSYQWLFNGKAINGAVEDAYTPGPTDIGGKLAVEITAKSPGRQDAKVTVQARWAVAAGAAVDYNPRLPQTTKIGKTLTAPATPAGWSATYQWTRNGKAIKAAIKANYKTVAADGGKSLRVAVTLTRHGFEQTVRTSDHVAVAKGAFKFKVAFKGQFKVGKAVKVTVTKKPKGTKIKYQWFRDGKAIPGKAAKKATYRIKGADSRHNLQVRIKATKSGYASKLKLTKVRRVG